MGWGDTATKPQCVACLCAQHPCSILKNAPDIQSTPAIFGPRLATAVTCHTGDTHTARLGRPSTWFLVSGMDFRLKQEANKQKKPNKPQIPSLLHIMGGNSKMSARQRRRVPLLHLLQHAATPKLRTPATFYLGNLRGIAGRKPKRPLFPRSSNPQRKSSNDSLQSCGSPRTSA